ncbi:MAG: histidine--tRNA ligase [Pseudomonadota bacterium]
MVQAIRGMRDVLPDEGRRWRDVESRLVAVLDGYAYEEVQLPLLEFTELFARGVGEATDIVEKEMYSFADRDGESLSLRPEGTAGCVRVLQQHGLLFNQSQRVFYRGNMFRYERPQKGRYRQFYQIGAEAFGMEGPDVDAELLLLCRDLWRTLGIEDRVRLELNSIGSSDNRAAYRSALVDYLSRYEADLDEDSQRRLTTNPLRILDSKDAGTQRVLEGAPNLSDFLDEASIEHFEGLTALLDNLGLPYVKNPRLVRGLDYYNRTVFEWITDDLGAQGTICGGGRYDGLVEQLGGKATPGAGFALGLERALLLYELNNAPTRPPADVYGCALSAEAQGYLYELAGSLRAAMPELRIRVHAGGGKLKNQLKKADQCGAAWALIVGQDEQAAGVVTVKALRSGEQQTLALAEAIAWLAAERTE